MYYMIDNTLGTLIISFLTRSTGSDSLTALLEFFYASAANIMIINVYDMFISILRRKETNIELSW